MSLYLGYQDFSKAKIHKNGQTFLQIVSKIISSTHNLEKALEKLDSSQIKIFPFFLCGNYRIHFLLDFIRHVNFAISIFANAKI